MPQSSSVPVTGMAWTTALGSGLDDVWRRLLAAESGFVDIPCPFPVRNPLAAPVSSVPADLPGRERVVALAADAARRALAADGEQNPADVRLVIGTSLASYLEDDPGTPLYAWADDVARALGLKKPPLVVSTACSAGADAIRLGGELLRSGAETCCLCGGADILTVSKRLAHSALGTMSPTLLRAFDVRHDGTLLGEGAAFMVLRAPGARQPALALLRGAGAASDAESMTAPDTSGTAVRMAVERSLAEAGVGAADIAVINAHASATPLNDLTEREAFRVLFAGMEGPVVFGTKGNFGHSLGATGALEAVALILALRYGVVPPVVGLEQPDPGFPLRLPRGAPVQVAGRVGMSLTLGFGGFDTSLVLEGPP